LGCGRGELACALLAFAHFFFKLQSLIISNLMQEKDHVHAANLAFQLLAPKANQRWYY
jgi:hypothetical protein